MEYISVVVTPAHVHLAQKTNQLGEIPAYYPKPSHRFTANVSNDPGNLGVTWSVAQGGGQIDDMGVFYAPDDHGKTVVKATSVADKTKSATATVTYLCPAGCLIHKE